jgi:hypothetical protein
MKLLTYSIGLLALASTNAIPAKACESYVARLSAADHFNSRGERLSSAAAIIRQDRANFYLFGKRDAEDEDDAFFASKDNRAKLEWMLEHGQSSRAVLAEIVNGTPLIEVTVCQGGGSAYINVTLK